MPKDTPSASAPAASGAPSSFASEAIEWWLGYYGLCCDSTLAVARAQAELAAAAMDALHNWAPDRLAPSAMESSLLLAEAQTERLIESVKRTAAQFGDIAAPPQPPLPD
jgi:hypothetical protein